MAAKFELKHASKLADIASTLDAYRNLMLPPRATAEELLALRQELAGRFPAGQESSHAAREQIVADTLAPIRRLLETLPGHLRDLLASLEQRLYEAAKKGHPDLLDCTEANLLMELFRPAAMSLTVASFCSP
jgi:hypothetical protein